MRIVGTRMSSDSRSSSVPYTADRAITVWIPSL
jgi:hypothetical protein